MTINCIGNEKYRQGQLTKLLSKSTSQRKYQESPDCQERYYDKNLQEQTYNPGNLVWIDKRTLNALPRQKLACDLKDPFEVVQRNNNGTYHVKDSKATYSKKLIWSISLDDTKYDIESLVVIEQVETSIKKMNFLG